ncbi:MAG TPA: c-type cytochrome [Myxococcales bacterium]|nr:c-type cytochrome [Myxococcales bacterium]
MIGSLFILLAAAAAAGSAPASGGLFSLLPDNPLQGSRLFADKGCLECHSVQSTGGRVGPDLGRGRTSRPLLEIAGVMWNHSPRMEHAFRERHIARPKFDAKEMAGLLAFLYSLGSFDEPGDAVVGARVFRDKQCSRCHSVGGIGGQVGPALDRFAAYASPVYLTSALWNSGKRMSARMKEMNVERPVFEGKDIVDLLAFIRREGGGLERVYAQPGNPRNGERLFVEKRCSGCHAINAQGGRQGPDLGRQLRGTLMQVAGAMWNHGPGMWTRMSQRGVEVPKLTPEEAGDLTSYLYFLQFIDQPGNPQRGLLVYREAGCVTCHESVAGGKRAAPALTGEGDRFKSSLEIVASMWNHGAQMEQLMAEVNVAWPTLKGTEMADLIAYLFAAGGKEVTAKK